MFELDALTEVLLRRTYESSLIPESAEATQLTGNTLRDLFVAARKKRVLGERVVINSNEVIL